MKLTIYYDQQFWVGIVESERVKQNITLRHVFGPEPSNMEVLLWVQTKMINELESCLPLDAEEKAVHKRKRMNAKRLRRLVKKETKKSGVGTKAQQAIKRVHAMAKEIKTTETKKRKERVKQRHYQIRKEKARRKHRGK